MERKCCKICIETFEQVEISNFEFTKIKKPAKNFVCRFFICKSKEEL